MKKLNRLFAVLSMTAAAPAFAQQPDVHPYVFVGAGYQNLNAKTYSVSEYDLYPSYTSDSSIYGSGVSGQLGLGLQLRWSQLLLDGNVYLETANTKALINNNSSYSQTQIGEAYIHGYGATFRPTYVLTPALKIQGILGLQRARFNLWKSTNDSFTPSYRFSPSLTGLQYGIGLSQALTAQWDLRVDLTRTRYQNYQVQFPTNASLFLSSELITYKPSLSTATLSIVRYF